jgi:hypothetical protein
MLGRRCFLRRGFSGEGNVAGGLGRGSGKLADCSELNGIEVKLVSCWAICLRGLVLRGVVGPGAEGLLPLLLECLCILSLLVVIDSHRDREY